MGGVHVDVGSRRAPHSGPGKGLETVLGLDPKPLSVYILITVFA